MKYADVVGIWISDYGVDVFSISADYICDLNSIYEPKGIYLSRRLILRIEKEVVFPLQLLIKRERQYAWDELWAADMLSWRTLD